MVLVSKVIDMSKLDRFTALELAKYERLKNEISLEYRSG